MALYLAPFAVQLADVAEATAVAASAASLGHRLAGVLPGGAATLWVIALLVLAGLYQWVLHRAERMELPKPQDARFCGGIIH